MLVRMRGWIRGHGTVAWRALVPAATGATLALLAGLACDDAIEPRPPKTGNLLPESFLVVHADSLSPQFYELPLSWLGSDPDGHVVGYRFRWVCQDLGGQACSPDAGWQFTTATRDTFNVYVPRATARYRFELAAVDDAGGIDPTPAAQLFSFHNAPPVVSFQPRTKPTRTLPAATFYLQAVDPDSTTDPNDHDGHATIATFRAWLDGRENDLHDVPAATGGVTFKPQDFEGRYGARTVFVQALDDGGAVSAAEQHTWTVDAPVPDGILLVDDCRMGGFLESRSDQSYRNAVNAAAPGRAVVLDVETIPRIGRDDFEATLSLFRHVVWYTDADTLSSGALEAARAGLDSLLGRGGHLLLVSGLAFGTRGAFGSDEPHFRDLFGIEQVFRGPNGSTNFALSREDTVVAAVTPSLPGFRVVAQDLRAIMECFASRQDSDTRSLYYYPESTFVRTTEDSLQPFVNPVQFDVGVRHALPAGARALYVSFLLGLPINHGDGVENETEIRELLRLAAMIGP